MTALSLLPGLSGAVVPQFKDRGEYDLALQLERQGDPVLGLALLRRWVKLYPDSAFEQERDNSLIKTYQALKMGRLMLDAARQMAAEDPHGLGNYWIALLTVSLQDPSQSALREGRTAAEAMLQNSDASFAPSNCPASVPLKAWLTERDHEKTLAHRTLGWVDLREKRFSDAEREFTTVLQSNPNDAESFFWLGIALIGENGRPQPKAATVNIARSLVVTGEGALLPEAKRLVKAFYKTNFDRELPLPSFMLPVSGPERIAAPHEASVLYPAPSKPALDSKSASRGALLVHPVLDIGPRSTSRHHSLL